MFCLIQNLFRESCLDHYPNQSRGVYIDLKISPDSFINEDKKENKSDAIDKSRPNKDSISWKFKCKE